MEAVAVDKKSKMRRFYMEENGMVSGSDQVTSAVQVTDSGANQERVNQLICEIRSRQNLTLALVGGAIAAVIGASIWAAVTVAANVQIGWMAVGVGFLVGGAIRVLGKGIDKPFGYVGAILSLLGCVLGNLLSIYVILAKQEALSVFFVLTHVNISAIPELLSLTFHPMDLLFYAIAVYEGYRFSFRNVTQADLSRVVVVPPPGQ